VATVTSVTSPNNVLRCSRLSSFSVSICLFLRAVPIRAVSVVRVFPDWVFYKTACFYLWCVFFSVFAIHPVLSHLKVYMIAQRGIHAKRVHESLQTGKKLHLSRQIISSSSEKFTWLQVRCIAKPRPYCPLYTGVHICPLTASLFAQRDDTFCCKNMTSVISQ